MATRLWTGLSPLQHGFLTWRVLEITVTTKLTSQMLERKLRRMLSIRHNIPVWISGNYYWRMEQHFSEFMGKEDNLAEHIQIFRKLLPRISVPFDFRPRISGIFGWMVRFSESQTLPWNFGTICPHYIIFGIFGSMESTLGFLVGFVCLLINL